MSPVPLLQLSDAAVRVGGPSGPLVLDALTLTVWPGESVVVIGESGVGKTTLLRAVAGLLPLERGRRLAPERMGWIPQHVAASFDPRWTVLRSVAEPARLAGIERGAAQATALELLSTLRLGKTQWRLRPVALSGGQVRRAAIARALAADPSLVLADEPTAGLDPEAALNFIHLLRERLKARNRALLWATHDLGVAALLADRVLVLEGGRIVEAAWMRRLVAAPRSKTARHLIGAWLPLEPEAARRQLKEPGAVAPRAEAFPEQPKEE
jgi:ABC-type glutathione transport system ATPase component